MIQRAIYQRSFPTSLLYPTVKNNLILVFVEYVINLTKTLNFCIITQNVTSLDNNKKNISKCSEFIINFLCYLLYFLC